MKKRKLFVLVNNVWRADDYLNERNCDSAFTDLYLFSTKEDAEKQAKNLDVDSDLYNDCSICVGTFSEKEILDISGFESIADFDEALREPYATGQEKIEGNKNYGESEKTKVAIEIFESPDETYDSVDCANYDFDKSLDGAILVFWKWERYVGYARKCLEVRKAHRDDTEALLVKRDNTTSPQVDVLLTAEEVGKARDLHEAVSLALGEEHWKWTNPGFVKSKINEL